MIVAVMIMVILVVIVVVIIIMPFLKGCGCDCHFALFAGCRYSDSLVVSLSNGFMAFMRTPSNICIGSKIICLAIYGFDHSKKLHLLRTNKKFCQSHTFR